MRFGILGSLTIEAEDESIVVSGSKPRALLALLLLHANRDVPAGTLIDRLWIEPPKTAANALQVYVGKLRRALSDGEDRLVTTASGYRLRIEPDELDALVFEQLCARARAAHSAQQFAAASTVYERALALWRGDALEEFRDDHWAHAERARLEARRTAAFEGYVEARLADGRHADVIAALESELAADPGRERVAAQLMIALYRSARQLDALAVAQRVRRHLADEHGVEPGDELRRIEYLVLTQSPDLDLHPEPRASRVALPAVARAGSGLDFVGRRGELATLEQVWDDVVAGATRLVVVAGEPGIGKTRLASQFAADRHDAGGVVLWGRCAEHVSSAFRPFVEALTPLVASMDASALEQQLGDLAPALATLIPAAGALRVDAPNDPVRAEQFDAVAELLRAASKTAPVLLALDDVQWVDNSSRALVDHLTVQVDLGRVLVLLVARDTEGSALAHIERAERIVTLDGLDPRDIVQLVAGSGVDRADALDLAHHLYQQTAGNPLFVEQLLRHGDEHGNHPTNGSYPEPIRAVIERRLGTLPAEVVRTLELASVIGREFDALLVAEALSVDTDRVLDALGVAVRARLVVAAEGTHQAFAFVHELLRQVVYDSVSEGARASQHRAIANALETDGRRDTSTLAALARHWTAAQDRSSLRQAIDYERLCAESAAEMLAFEDAARHYEQAVALLVRVDPANREMHCDLLLGLGRMRFLSGAPDPSKAAFLSAVELARDLGEWERLAAVAIGGSGWTQQFWAPYATVSDETVGLLHEALAVAPPGDSALRATLLARLAEELHFSDDTATRNAYADDALRCARRIGDPATTADVLQSTLRSAWAPDNVDERIELSREMLDCARRARRGALECTALGRLATSELERGRFAEASRHIDQMGALLARYGEPVHQNWFHGLRGAQALMAGDFDECERLMTEAGRHISPEIFGWEQAYAGVICVLAVERDRTAEMIPIGEDFVAQYPQIAAWRAGLAVLLAHAGRVDEARAHFDTIVANSLRALRRDQNFLFCFAALAETASVVGSNPKARDAYDALLLFQDQWVVLGDGYVVWTHVERALGVFARSIGNLDASEIHLRRSVELHRDAAAAALLSRSRYELARTLMELDRVDEARPLLVEARLVADRVGQISLVRAIDALTVTA